VKPIRALTLIISAVLVAACSGTGTASPSAAPATAAPSAAGSDGASAEPTPVPTLEATTIRIVQASTPDFTQISLIKWQELLADAGITVEYINVEGGDIAFRTMIAGQGDVVIGGIAHLVNYVQATGEDAKLIAVDAVATDYIIVSQQEIATVQDLAGKNLGINRPGDAGDAVMRAALRGAGFDPEQANFLEIGGTSARVAALLAGQIDAGPAHAAEAYSAVEQGLKNLLLAGEAIGPYPQTGLMTTGEMLSEKPVLAQLAVDTFIDAVRWAADNKDEYIALSQEAIPDLSDSVRGPAYDVFTDIGLFGVDGGITTELMDAFLAVEEQAGAITGDVPAQSEWVDASLVEDYLERNGTH
jgi:ABC-type nitrate/sulfonate/bicarbonate transport system substrate-binding protein